MPTYHIYRSGDEGKPVLTSAHCKSQVLHGKYFAGSSVTLPPMTTIDPPWPCRL